MVCIRPNSSKCFLLLVILSSLFWFPLPVQSQLDITFSMNGPYIEKIAFQIMNEGQQQVLGLLDNEIDMIYGGISVSFIEVAAKAENIELSTSQSNGIGALYLNCDKYPLNVTAFRRALAFALDKEGICDDCFEGFALPHDSIIPDVNPWSIEGRLPYTYYDPNVELGKSLLDDAGFEDVDDDGFREAPDGSSFQVKIECYLDDTALQVGDMTADALSALGINAVSVPTDYYDYLPRLVYHGDYDIVFFEATFTNYDIDGLGHHFLSENADVPYLNLFNFKNTTVDIWAKKLIYATTFDEVQEASDELQKLLVYECPAIVCYQKFFVNAYRNDRFEGFIDIQSNNWWTYFNVKLRASFGGHYSGTIRCGLYDISTLNLLGSATGSEWEIFNLLYDSLIKLDPDNIDLNWLCENYTVQTHEDNPNVPDGRSKITFEIVQNATWTDGYPLTADDIAFTMNFRKNIEGSAYGEDFDGVEVAYAPTPYLVVVEFSTESIWNLHDISYKPILPKHIFQEIDVDDWEEWNPAPPDEPMVTSGPFNITEYIHGEFIEMTRFDDYFRGLDYTSQTNTTETQDYGRIMSGVLMGTISAVVTVITGVYILRKKEKA